MSAPKISTMLRPECIKLQLEKTVRTEAIREVAERLIPHPDMGNFDIFYEELLKRERVESTCLGNDVAFPHARTDHVKSMVLAAGRREEGVFFENCNQTVKLIFVIGTPKKMVTDYLTVVGALARILRDEELREKLIKAPSQEEFHRLLAEAEEKL